MSRSKRSPYWTEGYGGKRRKSSKREASKKIRNQPGDQEIPQSGGYKKMYETWSICDYKIYDAKNKKVRRK